MENNFNKEEFENILYEILKRKETEDINEINKKEYYNQFIDIDSPLFELMSKTKNFEKYTIYIALGCKLKEDYIILFNKLNKSNIKYSSIYYSFNDIEKLNYLKEFNLDFHKIKRIILEIN